MTFDPNVPNGSQSPGQFPAQNLTNYTRLKALINGNHVFNDTAQPDDGIHKRCDYTDIFNNTDPTVLPAGAVGVSYTQVVDGLGKFKYFDGTNISFLTHLTGTVTINSSTFVTIRAIPANVFGEVYLYKGRFIQAGSFVSDAGIVNGYSYSQKYVDGSGASQILNLGFDGAGANALNLTVKNTSGSSFNGLWTYKIIYRTK